MKPSKKDAAEAHLSEIHLQPFDEPTLTKLLSNKHGPLTESTKQKLNDLFKQPLVAQLALLYTGLAQITDHLGILSGLDDDELSEVRMLIVDRKSYKKLKREQIEISDMKKLLLTEKKLLPYSRKLEWWSINKNRLTQLDVWENISARITEASKKNHENTNLAKKRQHRLLDIKQTWATHQQFAACTSQQLLNYYKDNLAEIEKLILKVMHSEKTQALAEFNDYLSSLYTNIQVIKKTVIESLMARLKSAEYYHDLHHDDLMHHLADLIEEQCNLTILIKDKRPRPRYSLNTHRISVIKEVIEDFCTNHPDDTGLAERYQQSIFTHLSESSKQLAGELSEEISKYPSITFTSHIAPALMIQIKDILQSNSDDSLRDLIQKQDNPINKLASLIKQCSHELKSIKDKRVRSAYVKIFNGINRNFKELLTEIKLRATTLICHEVQSITDEALTNTSINDAAMKQPMSFHNDYNSFLKKYQLHDIKLESDLYLQLAMKIKDMIIRKQEVTPTIAANIIKLISAQDDQSADPSTQAIKHILDKLTGFKIDAISQNESDNLHAILQLLNDSVSTTGALNDIIKRHKIICSIYNENWEVASNNNLQNKIELESNELLFEYLLNVKLKTLGMDPEIGFNNFDNCSLADEAATIADRQLHNHLRIRIEEKIESLLNDPDKIRDYIYSSETNTIKLVKLNNLIDRINLFFKSEELKNDLINCIQQTCKDLMKQYYLSCLTNNTRLSLEYIDGINNQFGVELFSQLSKDPEVESVLADTIKASTGASSLPGTVLIHLLQIPESGYKDEIIEHAKARLKFILANSTATNDDFLFFSHFMSLKEIANLLWSHQKNLQELSTKLIDQDPTWLQHHAQLITLTGDHVLILAYQNKAIQKLIQIASTQPIDTQQGDILLQQYEETYGSQQTPAGYDTNEILIPSSITDHTWTNFTERLVSRICDPQILQDIHYQLTLKLLDKNNENDQWITEKLSTLNTIPDIYEFLSETLTNKLVSRLESHLIEVYQKIQSNRSNLKNLEPMLQLAHATIKFSRLYELCGSQKSTKQLFQQLIEIEPQLQSQHQLNKLISDNTTNNLEITSINQVLAIIGKVHLSQLISQYNIHQYLDYVTHTILPFLNKALLTSSPDPSFSQLAAVSYCLNILSKYDPSLNDEIARLKNVAIQKVNQLIDQEAGLPELVISKIASTSLTRSQWLKLWHHTTQLTLSYLNQQYINPELSLFLTNQMIDISNHIFSLSRHDKTLLKDFQQRLPTLNSINAAIKVRQPNNATPTLFKSHNPEASMLQHLASIDQKAILLNMVHVTEQFAEKFLSKQQYQLAKQTYFYQGDLPLPTQEEIMQTLSLHHTKRALKLMHVIELLTLMNTGLETGQIKLLTEYLENQINHETSTLNLFQSKRYLVFIKHLKRTLDANPQTANDRHQLIPQATNTRKAASKLYRLSG